MVKFFILVKKEIKELLTPQMLLPLVAVVLVFLFIGKVVGKETAKITQRPTIAVLDLDKTSASALALNAAKQVADINTYESQDASQALTKVKASNQKALLVIPKGFEAGIQKHEPQALPSYTIMQNFSFTGSRSGMVLQGVVTAINEAVSNEIISKQNTGVNPQELKNPVKAQNFVLVGQKQAEVNPAVVTGLISSQTTFIPIVLFLVIVMASQMIATSMAAEKENKTLETLLSSPVSRNALVAAKIVGAGIVALLMAAVYLVGMRSYMNGVMGAATTTVADTATKVATLQLGLTFSTLDYVLLGFTLFFGILSALSVAMILAAFAEDTKSAQGIISPLMLLILIPYFLTLFLDINSLSPGLRWLVYAIPFSHPFLAAPNILLRQYMPVLWGILYMALFFALFVFIASKLFSSDKILTLKLNFKKRH